MTIHSGQTSPAEILSQIVVLLDQATAEADERLRSGFTLANGFLAGQSALLRSEAMALLPDQTFPDVERPVAVGASPLLLLQAAESLTATLPIERFPPGMSHLVVRMIVTLRELS